MTEELERARQRESKLVAVFSAIDAREEAEAALGRSLVELRDLGAAQAELSGMTGLSSREVAAAIRSAKNTTESDADETTEDTGSESEHSDSRAEQNHDSTHTAPGHTYG